MVRGSTTILLFFFDKFPKHHLEFVKPAQIMETKGNKLLHNIKTKWISMLNPMKGVLEKYHSLLLEMVIYSTIHVPQAAGNLDQLCDVQVMFGLAGLMPLLTIVHSLVKFAQL